MTYPRTSSDELGRGHETGRNEDAPDNGAAYLIRELDGVGAEATAGGGGLARARRRRVRARGHDRVRAPGPLGTPFAHNKLVALGAAAGADGPQLIKYLN